AAGRHPIARPQRPGDGGPGHVQDRRLAGSRPTGHRARAAARRAAGQPSGPAAGAAPARPGAARGRQGARGRRPEDPLSARWRYRGLGRDGAAARSFWREGAVALARRWPPAAARPTTAHTLLAARRTRLHPAHRHRRQRPQCAGHRAADAVRVYIHQGALPRSLAMPRNAIAYDEDFFAWTEEQARLLRAGELAEIDALN